MHTDRDLYWIVPFGQPLIVAVLGQRFVGKSTALTYLAERHGFRTYTLASVLRDIARDSGKAVRSRSDLARFGDELRAEQGDDAHLARLVLRRIRRDQLALSSLVVAERSVGIGGIRHKAELEALGRVQGFRPVVLKVEDDDRRFERAVGSGALAHEWVGEGRGDENEFSGLTAAERRAYFRELDERHACGHEQTRGQESCGIPAAAISEAQSVVTVENDADGLGQLHDALDAAVRTDLLPRSRLFR